MEKGDLKTKSKYGATEPLNHAPASMPIFAVHAALIVAYVMFGGGAFVSKFGMHGSSPIVFELVRELATGPIFLVLALSTGNRVLPDSEDISRVLVASLCFFGNQICFFIGLKQSNPTAGTTWQTSMPIFTAGIAALAGLEKITLRSAIGILTACGGAACMTMGDLNLQGHNDHVHSTKVNPCIGHLFFLAQCLAISGHIIVAKRVVLKYGAISFASWIFIIAAVGMAFCSAIVNAIPELNWFLCGDGDTKVTQLCVNASATYSLNKGMIVPLVYEVVGSSLIGWYLIGWANKYAKASAIAIYTVVQPVTSAVLAYITIAIRGQEWAKSYGILRPGWENYLGAGLIAIGLCVMFIAKEEDSKETAEVGALNKSKLNSMSTDEAKDASNKA